MKIAPTAALGAERGSKGECGVKKVQGAHVVPTFWLLGSWALNDEIEMQLGSYRKMHELHKPGYIELHRISDAA